MRALEALRAQIEVGIAELDRGDFTEVDESELAGFLAELGRPRVRKARRKRTR